MVSRLPVKNFLSHRVENILEGTFLCFEKILVAKKFLHNRRASRFCPKFFVSWYQNLLGVTLVFQRRSGMEENYV